MNSVAGWKLGDFRSVDHLFTIEDLHAFDKMTGGNHPIHMDKNSPYSAQVGRQVIHEMLVASFISTLIGMEIPGPGALWNDFKVNWSKIIRTGDKLRFIATVSELNPSLDLISLDIQGIGLENGEVYLNGSAKVMIMSKKDQMKTMSLDGKTVLLTGAAGVLGRSVCRELVKNGANLIIWGRDIEKLEEVKVELGSQVVETLACDLSDEKTVQKNIKYACSKFHVDGIIHLAASSLNNISAVDPENIQELKKHFEVGVIALQILVNEMMLKRAANSDGFITAVLTEGVFDAPPANMSAYISSKMAIWGLIKSYAKELGPLGIRCNAISPGLMETPYSSKISISAKKIEEASNPMRRICNPNDVARAICFLSTSGFINGTNMPVTGGQRMP